MIDKIIERLDPQAQTYVMDILSKVSIKSMNFTRTIKNPESSSFNSDGIGISMDIDTSSISLLDTGNVSMVISFIQEANILIDFLTTGVLHSSDYKIRRDNLIERFNRLMAIRLGYKRDNKPFQQRQSADLGGE